MKLQRLELFGFKSFADRVSIEFNPGLTAIVGPNGCGKSNISDAIRWVLGEQRPTMVRGSKMAEVIFAGTRERKPINIAEATLHFSNEDGLLPVEYSEVSITRRVYREGESEYLLNRQPCRLKDIQSLFFGTGIGTHAYSLIQQGMVDSVLSDRTEERRTIFEEAAGVTRYKDRRRATERKLEATTRDLERVEDIVAEVEKTVRALKRQVGRTRRFRQYRTEEERLDVHLMARELEALAARELPLLERLRALESAEAEQAARIAALESEIESTELEIVEGREAERGARERAEELRREIARREESRLVTGESLKHNRSRLSELAGQDERAARREAELVERRRALESERDEAAERLEAVVARLERGEETDGASRHAELRAEREALGAEVEDLRDALAEARQDAARHASAAEAAGERLDTLEAELEQLRAEREEAGDAAERAREVLENATEAGARAGEEVAGIESSVAEATERLEAARERVAAERAAEQAAAGRLETLRRMEERYEGYGPGVRALLSEAEPVPGLLGALPRAVEPSEPRFEAPLERYLESLGHGLLARDREAAERAADRLAENGGGRADFLVPEFLANGPAPALPDPAAAMVVGRGTEVLRWTGEADLYERLEPLFGRLLVVSDRDDAFRCREALADRPEAARHFVIAALDGTLLEPTGRWGTPGAAEDAGVLGRRRRLVEAGAEAAERGRALERAAGEVEEVRAELSASREALARARERAAEAEERRRSAREELVVAEGEAERAIRRIEELERQVEERAGARDRARRVAEESAGRADRVEADLARTRERLEAVREALEREEAERIDRQSSRHAVELDRARAEAALRTMEREIEHVVADLEALAAGREERDGERERLEEANARLEAERKASSAEIESLNDELDAIEARLRENDEGVRELEEARAEKESELRALRRAHEETTEQRHEATLVRQEIEHRRQSLREHLEEQYEDDLETLLERHPLEEEEAELDVEEMRRRLEEVRRKRANLGPVNMLAVEEYERESERLAFLHEQRSDLVQARGQLQEAIRRIDATARELFEETFAEIGERFESTFRTLFEGGHAEVRLADPDDPLESPIEIVASPRGKRVKQITLLSGGERALTALALLFAIYQVKPSPFCVLDEVDAPLDDANVSRFLKMLSHFRDRTQFVIITHNKRTMQAADYLYGVTMEEPGISTLVSVALEGSTAGNGAAGGGENGAAASRGSGNGERSRTLEEVWSPAR
ncbi:MAG: chromosome segregation protein SMC [Gemmatimonadota bacterium]|nr:chromosome segregation protein SMC [Gemmatimonadota bacterium]